MKSKQFTIGDMIDYVTQPVIRRVKRRIYLIQADHAEKAADVEKQRAIEAAANETYYAKRAINLRRMAGDLK